MKTIKRSCSAFLKMVMVCAIAGGGFVADLNRPLYAAEQVAGNVLRVRDVYGMPGQVVTIYVDLDNEDVVQNCDFKLVLPTALSAPISVELTDRKQDHQLSWDLYEPNTYRILILSWGKKTLLGNSGAILRITCQVGTPAGTYALLIKDAKALNPAYENVLTGTQDAVVIVYTAPAKVRIKTWLEGFNAVGYLRTDIRAADELPWTSPYPEAVRTATSLPATSADWILLEMRGSPTGPALQKISYLLKNDGFLCEMDGTTTTLTLNMPPGTYWLVLRHRNHAAVMSSSAQTLNSVTAVYYDFILGPGQFYGGGGKSLGGGYYAMPCGDINGEGRLSTADYAAWYHRVMLAPPPGYHDEDLNGDRQVNDSDYTLWLNNARLGWDSRVP